MTQPPPGRPAKRLIVLPIGGLLLFVFAAVSALMGLQELIGFANQRASALRAENATIELLSAVKDVETGARGYVIAGTEEHLAPYHAGVRQLPGIFQRLEGHAATTPLLRRHLPILRTLASDRVAQAEALIATRKEEGEAAALALVGTGAGKRAMDAFRSAVLSVELELRAEVARIESGLATISEQSRLRVLLATAIGTFLLVVGIVLLARERGRRTRAEWSLAQANQHLESRIAERTAELEKAHRQMAQHAVELDRSVENERRRLAREVHDQLGQLFTAMKLSLPQADAVIPPMQRAMLLELVDEGVATARRIASELRPAVLDDFGLAFALAQRGQRFTEETGLACVVDVTDSERLGPEQATQLYRIACEAMTNVARHAAAKRVRIEGRAEPEGYRLGIEDDGRGMLGGSASESFGMRSMRERAALAGGRLELGSSPWGGLRVTVHVPDAQAGGARAAAAG